MKFIFVTLILFLFSHITSSQSSKKYPIGDTGCSIYMFCNPEKFEKTIEDDSSIIYKKECIADHITYGVFVVQQFSALQDPSQAEEKIISYLDFLKEKMEIGAAMGYSKGHYLNNNEKIRGVIDNWVGPGGIIWNVKGWTDGKFVAILYVHGKIVIEKSKKDAFLNGFNFPAM